MSTLPVSGESALTRQIGSHTAGKEGPTFIVIGGLHGNEPAGIEAVERVLDRLVADGTDIVGTFCGLRGNLAALDRGVRFIDCDLNRIWFPAYIKNLLGHQEGDIHRSEDRELLALLEELDRIFEKSTGEVIVFDLHTSSADGEPFAFIGDTLRNRRLAFDFPVPVILGLEEQLDGGLNEYLGNRGCVTLGFEGGQHARKSSVDHLETAIWITLVAAGMIDPSDAPDLDRKRRSLAGAAAGIPPVLEVRYRHGIDRREDFEMVPGYMNFHAVRKGDVLAHERGKPVNAKEGGCILLPLYQALGSDGFFLSRPFRPFWLVVSRILRRVRFDRIVRLFPGVHSIEDRSGMVRIDSAIAKWFVVEVFHLLGYRKHRPERGQWILSRRKFDLVGPPRIESSR